MSNQEEELGSVGEGLVFILCLIIFLLGILGGCLAGYDWARRDYQTEAKELNYAHHRSDNGEWEWIKPEEQDDE